MKGDFPRTVEAIDNAWLSAVLGAEVISFSTTFLEGGVLSDAFKLHDIEYLEPSAGAPRSVVAKLPCAVPARRENAVASGAYIKELNFFRELAADVPIRTPEMYAVDSDGSSTAENFILVMEDLGTHSKVFDQVDDPPDEAFSRRIALDAAALHAKFWESPTLALPWVSSSTQGFEFPMDVNCRKSPETLESFRTLWEKMFGIEIFDNTGCDQARETTEILCGLNCDGIHDYIYDVLSTRPRTLLHGDLRADNIFRTDPALGRSVEDSELTYIDWQLITAGPPGPEFTQAWQHSLPPEVRRKDLEMLRQYHARLVGLNPAAAAYTYETLLEDYLFGFLFWWSNLVSLGVTVLPMFDQPEGQRMKKLWGQGLVWMLIAMTDHDCLSLVRRIQSEVKG
jgi:hypothetical protein